MLLVSKSTLMIKSIRNPLLLLACLVSFALLSCSKNDDGPSKSRTELLTVSAWKIASVGIDLDKNGTIDLPYTLEACEKDNTYSFHTDGHGEANEGAAKCDPDDPQTSAFSWSFKDNEKILSITYPGSVLSGDTNIKSLSSSKMEIFLDTTDPDSGFAVRLYVTLTH